MVPHSLETRHWGWKGPLITGGDRNSPEDAHTPQCRLGLPERPETSLLERRRSKQGLFEGTPGKVFCLFLFFQCWPKSENGKKTPKILESK